MGLDRLVCGKQVPFIFVAIHDLLFSKRIDGTKELSVEFDRIELPKIDNRAKLEKFHLFTISPLIGECYLIKYFNDINHSQGLLID